MSDTFENKWKNYYHKLKPIFCPALDEVVYFNAIGLNHLLYKGRRPRNINERHYRLALLKYVRKVLAKATHAVLEVKSANPPIHTWSLEHEILEKVRKLCIVKVIVIRKKLSGRLYFLSVMCHRKKYRKRNKNTEE